MGIGVGARVGMLVGTEVGTDVGVYPWIYLEECRVDSAKRGDEDDGKEEESLCND